MYSVLVVDDDPRSCYVLSALVYEARLGFEVVEECRNGRKALERIRINPPHLTITDIRMPVMDGLQLIRGARELGCKASFIITSAYADFASAQEAIRYKVASFLLKPIKEEELQAVLREIRYNLGREQGPVVLLDADILHASENAEGDASAGHHRPQAGRYRQPGGLRRCGLYDPQVQAAGRHHRQALPRNRPAVTRSITIL